VNHKHFDLEDWQKTLGPLLEAVAGADAKAQIQKMALQVGVREGPELVLEGRQHGLLVGYSCGLYGGC
jgi:hypothetical protein